MTSNEPGAMYGMEHKMVDLTMTDVPSVVRANLETILKEIRTAIVSAKDRDTKMHLNELIVRVKAILERDFEKLKVGK